MFCPNCGCSINTNNPRLKDFVYCPQCGRKCAIPSSAAVGGKPASGDPLAKLRNAIGGFMRLRIGGRVPAWCALLAVVIVLIIIIIANGGSGSRVDHKADRPRKDDDDFFEKYEQYDFEKNVEQFPLFDPEFDIYEISD